MAMRMAVSPAHRLKSVKKLGTSMRTGILLWRKRSRRCRRRSSSSSLGNRWSMPTSVCCLGRYCRRASRSGSGDLRSARTVSPPTARWPPAARAPPVGGRQRSTPETNGGAQAEGAGALPASGGVASFDEGTDARGDRAGDLHDGDLAMGAGVDEGGAGFFFFARFVRGGFEEAARHVDRADDLARHW